MCFSPPSFSLRLNWVCRWNEINNMSHNRSFFALELTNREESVQFQTVSLCRHCTFAYPSVSLFDLAKLEICRGACHQLVSTMRQCLHVGGVVTRSVWVCYVCVGHKVTYHQLKLSVELFEDTSKSALKNYANSLSQRIVSHSHLMIFFSPFFCRKTWKPPNTCAGCVWPDSSFIRLTRVACKCFFLH